MRKGGATLFFHHFDAGLIANHFIAIFNGTNAANIQPTGRIKFERVAASCGLRATKHNANFHTNLIDKNNHRIGARNRTRQFAQGLAH